MTAITRAEAYGLFAEVFSYPEQELWQSVMSGEFQAELCDTISMAIPDSAVSLLARADEMAIPEGTPYPEMESAYLNSFELDAPSSPCPLYEGAHARDTDRSVLLLEVKSFYQNFGLAVSSDLNSPEDHLAAELEFMAFLAAKQAETEGSGRDASAYIRAQRDFLERHLGRWLPMLSITAEQKVAFGFYRAMCRLVASFVASDQDKIADGLAAMSTAHAVGN